MKKFLFSLALMAVAALSVNAQIMRGRVCRDPIW